MDIGDILTDILVVLVAAKVAAEVAERIGVPAVVGEIVAGLLIGPSVLGVVGRGDDVLRTLGEIGVILLLLDVGLEMDIVELGKVGRASLLVATVGVACPLVLGFGAMRLIGDDVNTALFVGAALTATSVGITARVFGDLRMLATAEARIVLGAAVADDVMGLVVLTVVVRLVSEGSVSPLSVLAIIGIALAFLVVGGIGGLRLSPPLFGHLDRVARSAGTLVALALAFTLAFARLAEAARLAPIVGAFVAGIALSRTAEAGRIRRELAPVGHLFIPVFFLQIGIDAQIGSFTRGAVLRDAGVLLAVAIAGKLVAMVGAAGSGADSWLIGLGMLPRGEVGLIFATLGLQNGVLGNDLYASLLLVVLLTTLVTPPLIKLRTTRLVAARPLRPEGAADAEPVGGWLVDDGREIVLAARPPDEAASLVALQAALLAGRRQPSESVLRWLGSVPLGLRWGDAETNALLDVIERGNARSWRFLLATGALDAVQPALAGALRDREQGSTRIDLSAPYQFVPIERLRHLDADDPLAVQIRRLPDQDAFLVALFLMDVLDGSPDATRIADEIATQLGFDRSTVRRIAELVRDRELFWAAAHRTGALTERAVVPLAAHFGDPDQATAAYASTVLRNPDAEAWELARLAALHQLVDAEMRDRGGADLGQQRIRTAMSLAQATGPVAERIAATPRSYLVSQDPAAIARGATLVVPRPGRREVRVEVTEDADDLWRVDVGARDHPGLLATVASAIHELGFSVERAAVATWLDGAALESFDVRAPSAPVPSTIAAAITERLRKPLRGAATPDAVISFDATASPWHTICDVRAADRPGLLASLATDFTAARVEVVAASVSSQDGQAFDTFELTRLDGQKLDAATMATLVDLVHSPVALRWRRFPPGYVRQSESRKKPGAESTQFVDDGETLAP